MLAACLTPSRQETAAPDKPMRTDLDTPVLEGSPWKGPTRSPYSEVQRHQPDAWRTHLFSLPLFNRSFQPRTTGHLRKGFIGNTQMATWRKEGGEENVKKIIINIFREIFQKIFLIPAYWGIIHISQNSPFWSVQPSGFSIFRVGEPPPPPNKKGPCIVMKGQETTTENSLFRTFL